MRPRLLESIVIRPCMLWLLAALAARELGCECLLVPRPLSIATVVPARLWVAISVCCLKMSSSDCVSPRLVSGMDPAADMDVQIRTRAAVVASASVNGCNEQQVIKCRATRTDITNEYPPLIGPADLRLKIHSQ